MKTTKHLLTGLLIMMATAFGSMATAQSGYSADYDSVATSSDEKTDRSVIIETNLVQSISSEYNGVRETAIFNAIMLRLQNPDLDTSRITKSLNALLSVETEPRIRHKAHIALFLFENDNFSFLKNENTPLLEGDVYRYASDQMNTTFLSVNEANQ